MPIVNRLPSLLACCAVVAGCAANSGTTYLQNENPDGRYRTLNMNFTSGQQVQVRLRIYESQGKAAICGYLAGEGGFVDKDVTELWFQEATLKLGGRDFGKSDFLKYQWARTGAPPVSANCVASTSLAWEPGLGQARIDIEGGPVRRVY